MIFLVENEEKNNIGSRISLKDIVNKSSGLNYYEYCHIQFSDTVKVPGSNASRKKTNSVIKQRKDSNSFFSKVICKEGYYHLLSFLNNQDQLLDKL